jgi:D-alanine-D-alanine ligase
MTDIRTVTVFHNPVTDDSPEDEKEVISAAEEVSRAIVELGLKPIVRPFFYKSDDMIEQVRSDNPVCIFNLVESVMGACRLSYLAPAVFERHRIPFTGSSSKAIMVTTNKVLTKKILVSHDVATAPWLVPGEVPIIELTFPDKYIIKPIFEDASVGLDPEAVITARNFEDLEDRTMLRQEVLDLPCFAERFIDGREFNVSILETEDEARVMPPAEMHFCYDEGMLKIMDYKAKWAEDSLEYELTKRSFDLDGEDDLKETIRKISKKCWDIFNLRGYARVDYRVDSKGKPWVLEINANPCLQPESGLAAAALEYGLDYTQTIGRIIDAARY